MLRRSAVLAIVVALAGLAAVVLSTPAEAAGVTTSNITSPANGTRYFITDAHPATNVPVTGTSNGTTGDTVDVRCYYSLFRWSGAASNVPVAADGTFSTTMNTNTPYGTCILRAVPSGLSAGSNVRPYTGPRITGEQKVSDKITSGPNAGKTYDYYVQYQSARAENDYISAPSGGLWDSRLQYSDGTSSNQLWYENAALPRNEGTRSFLKVDGRNAYGPETAEELFPNNAGFPELTFTAKRNARTGDTTIHEIDPIVVCPNETPFPPTASSCPNFKSAGVRLERTIFTTDGGLQVHISDVWRSTDHKAHTVSPHYDQWLQGYDYTPPASPTPVGLKLPWLSHSYKTFTTDQVFPGPKSGPQTIFVRDDNTAPDGNMAFPRGAISFDAAPHQVHRASYREFTLQYATVKVPAGGTHLLREYFVIGNTDSQVAAIAAKNRKQLG